MKNLKMKIKTISDLIDNNNEVIDWNANCIKKEIASVQVAYKIFYVISTIIFICRMDVKLFSKKMVSIKEYLQRLF